MANSKKKDIYRFILIGLQWPRQELVKRIKKRIEIMVDNGLLEEAKKFTICICHHPCHLCRA